MLKVTVDGKGALSATQQLRKMLEGYDTMGRIIRYAASVIWIPLIKERLDKPTGTSGYEQYLDSAMVSLDPDFVQALGNSSGWANKTEAERRIPGGYRKGMITEAIEQAIRPSELMQGEGYLAIGIGNIDQLNQIYPFLTKDNQIKIWQVLQYGTGEFAGGGPVVRAKAKQIFFSPKSKSGVKTQTTVNPGFKGREYFVQLDGDIHNKDFVTMQYIMRYMRKQVERFSYR